MERSAETTSREDVTVRSLIVPLAGIDLLVPDTAVAEVVGYSEPMPLSEAAPWVLGVADWRGLRVPLISFEMFAGLAGERPPAAKRLVVFNTLNGNRRLPFVAVASQAIPRSVRLGAGMIAASVPGAEPGVAMRLDLQESSMAIPDLDGIEAALLDGGLEVGQTGPLP